MTRQQRQREQAIIDRHLNATPKERLFGALRLLQQCMARVNDTTLRVELEHYVEAALSWESLIADAADYEKIAEKSARRIVQQHSV